ARGSPPSVAFPGPENPSGMMMEDSPLTVAGAAAALDRCRSAPRSLLIPEGNRRVHPMSKTERLSIRLQFVWRKVAVCGAPTARGRRDAPLLRVARTVVQRFGREICRAARSSRALRAGIDPGLDQLPKQLLAAGGGHASFARLPRPADDIVGR